MHRMTITVEVPDDLAEDFSRALTGNDDDIILAAEKAMRERLGSLALEVELSTAEPFAPAF